MLLRTSRGFVAVCHIRRCRLCQIIALCLLIYLGVLIYKGNVIRILPYTEKTQLPITASILLIQNDPRIEVTRDECINNANLTKYISRHVNSSRHIAFLKIHKAASTTLFNIFYRFGVSNNSTFIIPRVDNYLSQVHSMRKRQIFPPPGNKTFDIVCFHGVFEKSVYEAYMPSDTVYIASIREPAERTASAFWYYRSIFQKKYLMDIPGPNPLDTFLSDPQLYETKDVFQSNTNNQMALDFGVLPKHWNNSQSLKEHLMMLDKRLDLVLDSEYFSESLILLKRRLKWSLKDVLYITHNSLKREPKVFTRKQKKTLRKFLHLDYKIYDHFHSKLVNEISKQNENFFQEVENLKKVQQHVSTFCSWMGYRDMGRVLVVGETKWNEEFEVDFCDCCQILLKEVPAVERLRQIRQEELELYGPNVEYFLGLPW